MRLLGNIIWMLFGGIFTALYWFGIGCLFCITIIGICLLYTSPSPRDTR